MKTSNKKARRVFALCLTLTLVLALFPITAGAADSLVTETPAVIVTGKSVVGGNGKYTSDSVSSERSYTLSELKALSSTTQSYSAMNTSGTKNFYKATGIPVSELLKNTSYNASKDKLTMEASDGYAMSFDPGATYVQGSANTTGLGEARYFYPGLLTGSSAGAVTVPTILAWANTRDSNAVPATAQETSSLLVVAGQLSISDQNNPLYNKNVSKVRGGDAITDTVLTVNGKNFTRAEILMMERAERSYTYTTKSGEKTDIVRGVPLKTLLAGIDGSYPVTFATADNYDVAATGMTVGELISKNYLLAYEVKENGAWQGIYKEDSSNSSVYGVLTLYGDDDRPASMIRSLSAAKGGAKYKHIDNESPYNLDALTGATITVEGPGVSATTPITVRELESANSAISAGSYENGAGKTYSYEGVDVLAIIDGMVNTGIVKMDDQVAVAFKNRWRQDIATITYSDLKTAKAAGKPVLLAYGVSDGSHTAPFVFDGATGYIAELNNDDGPTRLVYDPSVFKNAGTSAALGSGAFLSCAYLYVKQGSGEPGFKHSSAADQSYDNPANTEYLITLTGSVLGREVNYTVKELEAMVEYDSAGNPKAGGIGWRDSYSLSNTTYWYVNQYEGIQLWPLLTQKLGVSASKYSNDKDTLVSFSAWDNYKTTAQFSMYQLAHPEIFYYYEKSPLDIGTSRPTKAQLATAEYQPTYSDDDPRTWSKDTNGYPVMTGYPVVLAYGVNGYPYVLDSKTPGYFGGLGNDGGPLKVIFGKTDGMNRGSASALENYAYFYNNGSNQLQRAQEIYVGDNTRYSTHSQNPAYKSMASTANALTVEIISTTGAKTTKSYTLSELEDILYGVSKRDMDTQGRQEKGYYPYKIESGKAAEDLFEGVNLWYLLSEDIGMAGYIGSIDLYAEGGPSPLATYSIEDIRQDGYNSLRGTSGLGAMVAFAKNGYPLVKDSGAAGYIGADGVTGKTVKNSGGSLMFVRAQTAAESAAGSVTTSGSGAAAVENLKKIVVNLEADPCAHGEEDGKKTISFTGAVTSATGTTLSVSTLETKQKHMLTDTYMVGGTTIEYRGLDLYNLLNDSSVGASARMASIIVSNDAGQITTLSVSDLQDDSKRVILAYGSMSGGKGTPLTLSNGGLMRLVINGGSSAECITNVTKIEVVAAEATGWTHSYGNYQQYAGNTLEITGSNLAASKIYTVAELEEMSNIVVNDLYQMGGAYYIEGLDLYKLLQSIGFAPGITTSNISVYSNDGYAVSFTGTDLEKGVNGKPMLVAYAQGTTAANGLPLVPNDTDAGYDPNIGNAFGPLRLVVNDNTGWCNKWITKIVVGSEEDGPAASGDRFDVYGAGEDLPFAGVRSVKSDGAGGFWVGTYGGGLAHVAADKNVTVYDTKSSPALHTDFVSAVAPDTFGGVWFSQNVSYTDLTQNKGVGYLKDGAITWYEKGDKLPDNYVQAIEIDESGNVWFGSFGGLTRFDGSTWKTWTKSDGFPAASVNAITPDKDGGVWVGFYPDGTGAKDDLFTGGYVHMDKNGGIDFKKEYTGEYSEIAESSLLADVWVRNIAIDQDGNVWVVRSGSYANMPTSVGGRVDQVVKSADGYAIAKTYTGDELLGAALKDNGEIRAITADPIKGMWYGTTTSGVFYMPSTASGIQYSTETGAWDSANITLDNIYYLGFSNGALYAGSAGGVAVNVSSGVFKDVVSHWARENIMAAAELGIVNGYGDRTFGPNNSLTRAQFAAMLARSSDKSREDLAATKYHAFTDVPEEEWYAPYVSWASENGIAQGTGGNRFEPDAKITRQDMVTMLENYINYLGASVTKINAPADFSDSGSIADYAKQAVSNMQQYGIVNGKTINTFAPRDTATRAEAATVVIRLLASIVK